ncbi:MAG: 23S rRNA (adenine(2030)-N(6))-methyltransferase RlmJ [Caulobacteraceae bacterium]
MLQLLSRLTAGAPLAVLDTHAGAGMYDLDDPASRRSGEADAGVKRLMAAETPPAGFEALVRAVAACNPPGDLRRYPGSPALIVGALRPVDRFLGCELRPDDYAVLNRELKRAAVAAKVTAHAVERDGYGEVALFAKREPRGLVLIDAPFERGDEYEQVLHAVQTLSDHRGMSAAIWTPLKDLETFDSFLRGLEAMNLDDVVVAEVRLRPLSDPMKMNGCAMILVNAPDVGVEAAQICDWIAATLGESGGRGQVFGL